MWMTSPTTDWMSADQMASMLSAPDWSPPDGWDALELLWMDPEGCIDTSDVRCDLTDPEHDVAAWVAGVLEYVVDPDFPDHQYAIAYSC